MAIKNFKSFFVVVDANGLFQESYRGEIYETKNLDEARKFKSKENALEFLEENNLYGFFEIKEFYTSNKDITNYLS